MKHGTTYASLPEPREVLTVGLNRAVTVLAEKGKGRRGRAGPLKDLGVHPEDEKPVTVHDGRYGPYVKHGKTNATIPRDRDPQEVTLDEALELIAARVAKQAAGKKKAPAKKKPAARKKPRRRTRSRRPRKGCPEEKPAEVAEGDAPSAESAD